jgi:hypothetical protein
MSVPLTFFSNYTDPFLGSFRGLAARGLGGLSNHLAAIS